MALNLKHQTVAQLIDRAIALYKDADGERKAVVAKFILRLIADGDMTDAQLRGKLGLGVAEYATKKLAMQKLADCNDTLKSAVKE